MQVSEAMLNRIDRIDWFSRCGEPYTANISIPNKQVQTWRIALEQCKKDRSKEARIEARNWITAYLHQHHNEQYQEWNQITSSAKAQMAELIDASLQSALEKYRIDDLCILHATRWIVLAAMMEDAYRDLLPSQQIFFHDLLTVYEDGHFPCGWADDKWPSGTLLVY
jgi:hypothetical protein